MPAAHRIAVTCLIVLTAAVYLPAIGFDFVNWDDGWYVVDNPQIRSWQPANLLRIVSEPSVKNFAPLVTLSFLVDHTLWGEWAGGYHLTNLLLHAVNAVLVYALLWRLSGCRFTSFFGAVLFAVHPVQVESVAWVSSRKGLLSAGFILASLLCWLQRERTTKQEGYGLLFLLLALLARATAVVVPAVVLTYDLWVRRKKLSQALPRQLLPGTAALIFLLLTISAQATMYGGVRSHMELSRLQILAVDGVVLWRYVGMLVWPASLSVLYDPPTQGIALAATIAALGWAAVAWGVYRLRNRAPLVAWGLFTALAFLLPVLNLIPITTLMNDRYLYLPSIALFGLFVAGLRSIPRHFGQAERDSDRKPAAARFVLVAIVLAAVAGFAIRTHFQLAVWRNSLALWSNAATEAGTLPVVQYQLADAHYAAGNRRRAIALLEQALGNPRTDAGDRRRFEKTLSEWRSEVAASANRQSQ